MKKFFPVQDMSIKTMVHSVKFCRMFLHLITVDINFIDHPLGAIRHLLKQLHIETISHYLFCFGPNLKLDGPVYILFLLSFLL